LFDHQSRAGLIPASRSVSTLWAWTLEFSRRAARSPVR
jgi:hypothetical protein